MLKFSRHFCLSQSFGHKEFQRTFAPFQFFLSARQKKVLSSCFILWCDNGPANRAHFSIKDLSFPLKDNRPTSPTKKLLTKNVQLNKEDI